MTATNATWRRVADLPFQTLDEETIVINPKEREVHLLNETASRVWELCASPRTVDDLVAGLGKEYDAPADDLRRAVIELLDGLAGKHLVESR
jgi:Coenzyme PQQ synthesis protein D (PqqD)